MLAQFLNARYSCIFTDLLLIHRRETGRIHSSSYLFLLRVFVLLLVANLLTAHSFAHVVSIDVTPNQLQVSGFTFSVKCEHATKKAVAYTVEITAEEGKFPENATFSVDRANQKQDAKDYSRTMLEELADRHEVKVTRKERRVTCEFAVRQNSELSFIFCIPGPESAEFYLIKLKDFSPH